jgi:hypothetical protein
LPHNHMGCVADSLFFLGNFRTRDSLAVLVWKGVPICGSVLWAVLPQNVAAFCSVLIVLYSTSSSFILDYEFCNAFSSNIIFILLYYENCDH